MASNVIEVRVTDLPEAQALVEEYKARLAAVEAERDTALAAKEQYLRLFGEASEELGKALDQRDWALAALEAEASGDTFRNALQAKVNELVATLQAAAEEQLAEARAARPPWTALWTAITLATSRPDYQAVTTRWMHDQVNRAIAFVEGPYWREQAADDDNPFQEFEP